jgi:hypothetical protein
MIVLCLAKAYPTELILATGADYLVIDDTWIPDDELFATTTFNGSLEYWLTVKACQSLLRNDLWPFDQYR